MSEPGRGEVLAQIRFMSSTELKAVVNVLSTMSIGGEWLWVYLNLKGSYDHYPSNFWSDETVVEIMSLRKRMRKDLGLRGMPIDK